MHDIESRLHTFAHRVAHLRRTPTADRAHLSAIKHFQRDRLARTHADLLETPRFRLAAQFFLDELYGVKDFTARDAELARIIPTMSRLLPAAALEAIADAVELDALSEQLDDELAALWMRASNGVEPVRQPTEAEYCDLYRGTDRPALRSRQIELIGQIGGALDRLVGRPMLYRILKGMEAPARLAGLARMQSFLVSGFEAFRAMKGADTFVRTVMERETALMDSIRAGATSTQLPPRLPSPPTPR